MKSRADLGELEEFLHTKIPLTRAMQVRVESFVAGKLILCAPLAANHNHLGTAFGGSLAALSILAGYSLLWLELGDSNAHVVVRDCAMKFRRPVGGEIRAVCRPPNDEILRIFRADFSAKGKARVDLAVAVEAGDEIAVEFRGTYVAQRGSAITN